MSKIITPNMVENAIRLLKTPPDGTRANRQARNKAIVILLQHIGNLERFVGLNPGSRAGMALGSTISQYKELTKKEQK